jgi:hypothetical protein
MYFHRNCINKINRETKNVAIKGPKKDLSINLCKRFTSTLFVQTDTKLNYFIGSTV